jgi:hypothetical protein
MNNKPVAYVNSMCNDYIDWKIDPMSIDGQSLYTHPAKTYKDAIEECAQRAEAYAYMSPNFTALAEELRAILKKAQEK